MDLIFKEESYKIIGCCMEVYNTLGSGYLEGVYQEALAVEFKCAGIPFEKPLPVIYKGQTLIKRYFADFVCYGKIIVETKALSTLASEHEAQVLNYLKTTGFQLGLLVNFGNLKGLQHKRIPNFLPIRFDSSDSLTDKPSPTPSPIRFDSSDSLTNQPSPTPSPIRFDS